MEIYAAVIGGSAVAGYVIFRVLLAILPKRLNAENHGQAKMIINQARAKAKIVQQDTLAKGMQQLEDYKEDYNERMERRKTDLNETEKELETQEELIRSQEDQLNRQKQSLAKKSDKIKSRKDKFEHIKEMAASTRRQYVNELANKCQSEPDRVKDNIKDNLINDRTIEQQGILKLIEDDYKDSQKKLAARMLFRAQSRYMPNFFWPKATSHIEFTNKKIFDFLADENSTFIENFKEHSDDVNIELIIPEDSRHNPSVKFVGGFGVSKEACKRTFEDLLKRPVHSWDQFRKFYDKHYKDINQTALIMGQEAINRLELPDMHPDLMRMIGQLNWRTSYRQNQYLHTFEVAQLAGILGHELGVDPEQAKRSGLLHDIGKTIDYRIEGSHAVISADFADRFGETSRVCDAVLSHHNDLVLETPLAYVLKAADSLSGARPGARVNLEEGYQIRLSAIEDVVRSFQGVAKVEIMNGGREVHVEFNHKQVNDKRLKEVSSEIARKIEEEVAYPGQIKVLVSRKFEAVAVA